MDAYGEARKVIAFACIDGYYRHLKSELKKSALRQRSISQGSDTKILVDVDAAARDAVRCLEHAMVVVAGEKSIYRCVISPTGGQNLDVGRASADFKAALIRSYSHVVSAVVDRTMDIIELVFFKEAGIGQAAASEMNGAASAPRMGVRTGASAAAAGLRILDGVRILGPSLAKLCELSESRTQSDNTTNEAGLLAGQLCISIHRTTVKNCARTLENLSKAIQTDPLDGDQFRPPDCRAAPVSSDVVRAIRLISPFVSAYKSVSKRRYVSIYAWFLGRILVQIRDSFSCFNFFQSITLGHSYWRRGSRSRCIRQTFGDEVVV